MPGPGPKKAIKKLVKRAVKTVSAEPIGTGYVKPKIGERLGNGGMMTEKGAMTKRMVTYWQKKGVLDKNGRKIRQK